MPDAAGGDGGGQSLGDVLLADQLLERLRTVAAGDDDVFARERLDAEPSVDESCAIVLLDFVTLQTAADERPTAQRGDCLWLLYFYPDQVHRSPLRGPLIRSRRPPNDVVRFEIQTVKPAIYSADFGLISKITLSESVPAIGYAAALRN